MKKLFKILTIILITFFIIPSNIKAFASGITDKEILIEAKNMMPGDVIQGKLELKNKYENPISLSIEADKISDKDINNDLLEVLRIEILYDGEKIYDNFASELNGNNKLNINLGKLYKDEKKVLDVKAYLDGQSVGNEYQDKSGKFKLLFRAIGDENVDDTFNPSDDNEDISNKPTNRPVLPSTGMSLSIIAIGVAIIAILIGFKLLKKK